MSAKPEMRQLRLGWLRSRSWTRPSISLFGGAMNTPWPLPCFNIVEELGDRDEGASGETWRGTMRLTRRNVMCALGATLAMQHATQAAEWPTKIVRIIVPFPPGGAIDAI